MRAEWGLNKVRERLRREKNGAVVAAVSDSSRNRAVMNGNDPENARILCFGQLEQRVDCASGGAWPPVTHSVIRGR